VKDKDIMDKMFNKDEEIGCLLNIFPFQKKIRIKNEVNGNFQINKKARISEKILAFLY